MPPPSILVVDDSAEMRRLITLQLGHLGLACSTAVNGSQALKAFKEGNFALILMDIGMPIMDGLEATRAIREYEISMGRTPTPIVAVTGQGTSENCRQAGMNDCCQKPFLLGDIKKVLMRYQLIQSA